MKRILILAAAALLAFTANAQDGKSIYMKYSDAENVSAVYISPAMFRLVGRIPELDLGSGMDVAPVIKTLEGFYLIDSDNSSKNEDIKKDVEKMVKRGTYEMLMEVKDDGEVVHIYTAGTEKTVTSFVLISVDGGETTFISLDGQMPREQLEKLIASAVD